MTHYPSRRDFLTAAGTLVVSFSFVPKAALAQAPAAAKTVANTEVDGYLAMDTRGICTVYSGKVDLGTGVTTALRQIVADELDLPMERVDLVQGDTDLTPDQGKTWGSLTIQAGGMQLRQAAATARKALLEEAAQRLGTRDLHIINGVVEAKGGSRRISYVEMIGGKTFSLKLDDKAPQKAAADYKLVGKPIARVDMADKCTGRFTYMQDFRMDGMAHGRVIRPPAMGATLQSIDEDSVKNIPGLLRVVHEGNFLGVVCESEWGAIKAARQIKATWSAWAGLPEQSKLWDEVRATKIAKDEVTSNVGNTAEALGKAGKKLAATYDFAIHTHGSMGPSCAVANFDGGKLTVWTASQATHDLRKQLAQMFALPVESVRCVYLEGSGCYGRNGHEDAAADAALLAKAAGRPVRVQWSRADEHGWDPKGPPTLVDLRAGLDGDNVTAWESEFFIPQQTAGSFMVPLVAATLANMPAKPDIAPGNIFQDSAIPYKFANVKTVCHRLETTPFRPSWIRTPGRMQNTFANECFLDELAAAAGADPIAFRKKYLDPNDKRGLEILDRLAKLAQWQTPRAGAKKANGNIARGRGVSYVKYELVRTYVGIVADVEVDRSSGEIRVPRVFVTHDCGQIINPDGLKNQIEGNVIQTMSRTLIEELSFSRSAVTSLDWSSYPILTFPMIPQIVMDLIDRPEEKPWGAGEPAAAVVPSAISNAVFAATGARLRSVPFTPAKVKAALKGTA